MANKKRVDDFVTMKQAGQKISWLAAHDFPAATFEEAAGTHMILVVDSPARVGRLPQEAHGHRMPDGEAEPSSRWDADGASGRGRQARIYFR